MLTSSALCYTSPRPLSLLLAQVRALVPQTWFHYAQKHLVADEPTVQDYFRNFACPALAKHWLHPAEIPCDALVVLSGHDSVAEAREVHSYLRGWQRRARDWAARASAKSSARSSRRPRRLEVHLHESWTHGMLLVQPAEMHTLVSRLQTLALSAPPAGSPPATSRPQPASSASWGYGPTPSVPQTPTVEQLRIAARARQAAAKAADEEAAEQAAQQRSSGRQRAALRSAMHAKRAGHEHEPRRVVRFERRANDASDHDEGTADDEVESTSSSSSCEGDTASVGSSSVASSSRTRRRVLEGTS